MDEILIRASQAHKIMTEPKLKSDKEAGLLGETSKTYIKELFLYNEFGYKEPLYTPQIMKGQLCEQDSMALVQEVLGGEFRTKCNEKKSNEFICGTPDVVLKESDYIEDIKTSWDIKTFFNAELEKSYYWQGQCYMALFGKTKYRLIYCLVQTPEELVREEIKKYFFKFGCDEMNEDYITVENQITQNFDISKIEPKKRLRIFEFDYNQSDIDKLYLQVKKAREYYKTLKL